MASYNGYGRWAAARRSAKKAAEAAQVAMQEQKKKAQPRKGSHLRYNPLATYAYKHTQDNIDWTNPSNAEAASHLAHHLLDAEPKMQMLVLPTGLGKTAIAVAAVAKMQEEAQKEIPFCVVAPRAVVDRCGWHETISAYNEAHPNNVLHPIFIETFDRLASCINDKETYMELCQHTAPHALLIIDEVHNYKNPTAKRSKALQKVTHFTRLGLTATPFTNDIVLDSCSYLIMAGYYKNKTAFMKQNDLQKYVDEFNRIQVYDTRGKISDALWPRYEEVKKELASVVYQPSEIVQKDVDMPQLTHELIQIPSNADLTADMQSLAHAYDMRMFDSVVDYMMAAIERIYTDGARLATMLDICSRKGVEQPLIYYWHKVTEDALIQTLKTAHFAPQVISGDTHIEHVDFTSTQPILIQYQSGSEGIEFKKSNTAIFYENQGSYSRLKQAQGRNVRRGMTHEVRHISIVASDPFDRAIFEKLQAKEELNQEMLEDLILQAYGLD